MRGQCEIERCVFEPWPGRHDRSPPEGVCGMLVPLACLPWSPDAFGTIVPRLERMWVESAGGDWVRRGG
eukprot:52049-Pyramimonas_sp.AAC.1